MEIFFRGESIIKFLCLRMLQNHPAMRVIGVREGEGTSREFVKEFFLRLKIILQVPVIIKVIMRQVRENSAGKSDAGHAVLVQRMGRNFHEYIFAARPQHLGEKLY